MAIIELTKEESLTIENFVLKQQLLDEKFKQINNEIEDLKNSSTQFWKALGEKNKIDLIDKKIRLNGNLLEVIEDI